MRLTDKLRHNISKYDLLCEGDQLLVAVSGGADSVALLYSLYELRYELGLEIVVAHYNHALRRSAAKDQSFVRGLAGRLGLKFVTETNRKRVPPKGSLEEFARDLRYDFLTRTARRLKAGAIALAHTQDDLAETVLMRILRGTGLAGLQAMAFKTSRYGVALIRPFLNVSRQEIKAYLKAKKARFVNDPTNRTLDFTRNKVRLKLIPFMEKNFALDIKERLATLSETVAMDYRFLKDMAEALLPRVTDGVHIRGAVFAGFHRAMRRMVLRALLERLRPGGQALPLMHIDRMDEFIISPAKGYLSLPGGLGISKKANKIKLVSLSCEVDGLSLK